MSRRGNPAALRFPRTMVAMATVTHSTFWSPIVLDLRVRVTTAVLLGVHVVAAAVLFLVWRDVESLPVPWLWWNLQVAASIAVVVFMLRPTRGTCALAGTLSFVAFFGRALSYLWVIFFDEDARIEELSGYRFYVAWVGWTVMAVLSELLWWWISGSRDAVPRED